MIKKEFEAILILDWKKNSFRVIRKSSKNYKPSEIPIRLKLSVNLPEMKELEVKGDITLSEAKAGDLFMEEL